MRIAKWGNSLAVRLPSKVVDALGVKEGDEISMRAGAEGQLILEVGPSRRLSDEEFLARLRRLRRIFPADFKFDRQEANER